jgi:hypothetical protein
MSEPMSNREIEDVLSSIRRLVSDDLRPSSNLPNSSTSQADQPMTVLASATVPERTPEKLLLTPDFRVQHSPTPVDDAASEPVTSPKADIRSESHGGPEAAPAKFDIHDHYEWLTDPENDDWHSGTKGGAEMRQDLSGSRSGPDDVSGMSPLAAEASTGIEDVVSRLGAAVQTPDDEWEAPMGDADVLSVGQRPTSDDGTITAPELTFVPRARSQAASFEAGPSLDSHKTQSAPSDVDDHDEIGADTLVVPDADTTIDTAIRSDIDATLDSDNRIDTETGTAADVLSGSGIESVEEVDPIPEAVHPFARRIVTPPPATDEADWADAAEAAVMEDLASDVEREAAELFDETDGQMTFDEDVLRDLVRDIIREELAGTLGERITRNVRKLVRAEIARALAVREFE